MALVSTFVFCFEFMGDMQTNTKRGERDCEQLSLKRFKTLDSFIIIVFEICCEIWVF